MLADASAQAVALPPIVATAHRCAARCRPETMALSEADTMLASMPTPNRVALVDAQLQVGHGPRVGAGADRMLVVVEHADACARGLAQAIDEGIDRAVALRPRMLECCARRAAPRPPA